MEAKSLTTATVIEFVPAELKMIVVGATCDDALL